MTQPLDESYFEWLVDQVGVGGHNRNRSRNYWNLLRQLFTKEYVWIIPNDDNRVEDGRGLRQRFLEEYQIHDADLNWLGLGCSFLEMLVALSQRLTFEAEGSPSEWFWHLLKNLEIDEFHDRKYNDRYGALIEDILDRVMWRLYDANGRGGLFPLEHPTHDQREVELWYQLSAYILEREI